MGFPFTGRWKVFPCGTRSLTSRARKGLTLWRRSERAAPGAASRLAGTPIPRRPAPAAVRFEPAEPWTGGAWPELGAEGGAPAPGQKGGPAPHLRGSGPEGARQLGEGAFVFLTHLSRQLVCVGEGAGRDLGGPALPHRGASPPRLPLRPSDCGVGGGGALGASRSQHSPLGPRLPRLFQHSTPEFNPGVCVWGGGGQGTRGFCLTLASPKLLGSPEGGASVSWGDRTGSPILASPGSPIIFP